MSGCVCVGIVDLVCAGAASSGGEIVGHGHATVAVKVSLRRKVVEFRFRLFFPLLAVTSVLRMGEVPSNGDLAHLPSESLTLLSL